MLKKSFLRHLFLVLILLISSASARADDSSSNNPFLNFWHEILSFFHHHHHNNGNPTSTTPAVTPSPPIATPSPVATPTPIISSPPNPPAPNSPTPAPITDIPNACSPIGPQRIAVILADYQGAPSDTFTPNADYIRELFLGKSHDFSVSNYYQTVSRNKAWFESVTVLGPYHFPKPFVIPDTTRNGATEIGLNQWESDLVNLASADFDFSQIDRVLFITPNAIDKNGQSFPMAAGLATQGDCDLDSVNAQGVHHKLAHAWVLASVNYQYPVDSPNRLDPLQPVPTYLTPDEASTMMRHEQLNDMQTITHELGHTFGLGHSNQVNRPQANWTNPYTNNEILPAASDTIYELTYGDMFSVMGQQNGTQWLNVPHLVQLGWLDSTQVQEVRTEGTYRVYPLENSNGTLKGLKIPRVIQSPNESTASDLWVEYRQRSSVYDLETSGIVHSTNGALVHYTNPVHPGPNASNPFETVLLNFHPDGQPVNPYETDFTLTTSWKDDHSMVKLEIVQVTADYLDIHVSFEP